MVPVRHRRKSTSLYPDCVVQAILASLYTMTKHRWIATEVARYYIVGADYVRVECAGWKPAIPVRAATMLAEMVEGSPRLVYTAILMNVRRKFSPDLVLGSNACRRGRRRSQLSRSVGRRSV